MKRTLLLIGSALWLLFAIMFSLILIQYVGQGAGLQLFGIGISSGSVLMGMVHVCGFTAGAVICFAVAAGLFARGKVADQ